MSEETSPEETDKTSAVALDPYTCEVVRLKGVKEKSRIFILHIG